MPRVKIVFINIDHPKLQKGSIVSVHRVKHVQPTLTENRDPFGTTEQLNITDIKMQELADGLCLVDVNVRRLISATDNSRRRAYWDIRIKTSKPHSIEKAEAEAEFDKIKDLV